MPAQGTTPERLTISQIALSQDGALAWSVGEDNALVCSDLTVCQVRTSTNFPSDSPSVEMARCRGIRGMPQGASSAHVGLCMQARLSEKFYDVF